MKCPLCVQNELVMSERQGIEIDYCPKCRGVWLDRGELDKIIERSTLEDAGDDDRVRPRGSGAASGGVAPGGSAPGGNTPGGNAPMAGHGMPGHGPGNVPPHMPQTMPSGYGRPGTYNPNDDSKYGYSYHPPRKKSLLRDLLDF